MLFESRYLYALLLVVSLVGPLSFSFHPKLDFYKKWKYVFPAIFLMASVFIIWDVWFTSIGVWSFNPKYVSGITLVNLPLEEVLFFIVIPFVCLFVYHVLNINYPSFQFSVNLPKLITLLSYLLVIFSIFYYQQLYTLVTFSFTAIALIILKWTRKKWTSNFIRMYLIIWIPFLLVNGILTGSFIEEAVVRYNPQEIIGLRMGTIPVEDGIYNLLMLLTTTWLYEWLAKRY